MPRLSTAQPCTSPPCAPSPSSAFLPGKEKRSPLGRRLLKGQRRPSLSIIPTLTPPSLSDTCREPLKPGFPLPAVCFSLEALPSVQDGLDGRSRRWDLPGVSQRLQLNRQAVLGKATTTVRTRQTRHWLFVELSSVPGCLECGPSPRCESLRGDCGSPDFLHTQSPRC